MFSDQKFFNCDLCIEHISFICRVLNDYMTNLSPADNYYNRECHITYSIYNVFKYSGFFNYKFDYSSDNYLDYTFNEISEDHRYDLYDPHLLTLLFHSEPDFNIYTDYLDRKQLDKDSLTKGSLLLSLSENPGHNEHLMKYMSFCGIDSWIIESLFSDAERNNFSLYSYLGKLDPDDFSPLIKNMLFDFYKFLNSMIAFKKAYKDY